MLANRVKVQPKWILNVSSSVGRAAVSKTAGRRFEAYLACHKFALVAQLVEQLFCSQQVGRSIRAQGLQFRHVRLVA